MSYNWTQEFEFSDLISPNNSMSVDESSVIPQCLEPTSGNGSNYFDMPNPMDMLHPAAINPLFFPIIITHSISFVIGFLGNVFVVTVMIGDRKSRNATNLFLVSLAVSDLLLLLLCVPLETLQYFVFQWNASEAVCKVTKFIEILSAAANILTMCAVSMERFIVIVFPMRSRSLCTISNCRRVILLVWAVAIVLSTPVIPGKIGYTLIYRNCTENVAVTVYYCKEEEDESGLLLAIYKFVVLFAAPALLMLICYTYVIRELWRSTRNINLLTNATSFRASNKLQTVDTTSHSTKSVRLNVPSGSRSPQSGKNGIEAGAETTTSKALLVPPSAYAARQKILQQTRQNKGEDAKNARKQVIKMLILVIVLFLVCWGPKLILPLVLKLVQVLEVPVYFTSEMYFLRVVFNLIPFVHSCINPLIYSFMSKNFRRSMQRQVHRFCLFLGCKCFRCGATSRTAIPLRTARNRSTMQADSGVYSSNYCALSDATRHTEIECVSAM